MSDSGPRSKKLIEEEIEDLTRYLDGLPEEIRRKDAFVPYWTKLGSLRQELGTRLVLETEGAGIGKRERYAEAVGEKAKDSSANVPPKTLFPLRGAVISLVGAPPDRLTSQHFHSLERQNRAFFEALQKVPEVAS